MLIDRTEGVCTVIGSVCGDNGWVVLCRLHFGGTW